jgi:hypothetical protein
MITPHRIPAGHQVKISMLLPLSTAAAFFKSNDLASALRSTS